MGRMLKERAIIAACAFVLLLGVSAVAPRPALPARSPRPVDAAEPSGQLQGRVICVDPGHGGQDGGARARDSGTWEREMNLQVARCLRQTLEEAGATVVMTREDEGALADGKREDLTLRMEKAAAAGADMLLSIHMNEYRSRRESGPQVFYRAGQEESRLLAAVLQEALIEGLAPEKRREAMAGDYYVLSLDIPSVLVECGFISNSTEEKKLLNEDYQGELARSLTQGVERYLALAAARGESGNLMVEKVTK